MTDSYLLQYSVRDSDERGPPAVADSRLAQHPARGGRREPMPAGSVSSACIGVELDRRRQVGGRPKIRADNLVVGRAGDGSRPGAAC